MKNSVLVRVFALVMGVTFVWVGLASSVARAETPSARTVMASAGAQFRYTSGLPASQAVAGPAGARDLVLDHIRATQDPNYHPPTDAVWVEERTTPSNLVGAESYRYTSGAWVVTVFYPVVPQPVYDVTFEVRTENASFTWRGLVDESGRVIEAYSSGSADFSSGSRIPTTGDASGTDSVVALIIAGLIALVGAGAIIRWKGQVRSEDEAYILE